MSHRGNANCCGNVGCKARDHLRKKTSAGRPMHTTSMSCPKSASPTHRLDMCLPTLATARYWRKNCRLRPTTAAARAAPSQKSRRQPRILCHGGSRVPSQLVSHPVHDKVGATITWIIEARQWTAWRTLTYLRGCEMALAPSPASTTRSVWQAAPREVAVTKASFQNMKQISLARNRVCSGDSVSVILIQ
jgi:hypothetical protein